MEIFLQIGCKGSTKFLVISKMVDSFYQLPTIYRVVRQETKSRQ